MAETTTPAPHRQRKPVPRFAKLTRYPDGTLTLTIRQILSSKRQQLDTYTLTEIGADTGRGFHLTKPDGTVYAVNVGGAEESCDCRGSTSHGHCKHRDSIRKLIAERKL